MSATASVTGVAEWLDATFYWYFGPDRVTPDDSVAVDSLEVGAAWENRRIANGITQQSGWIVGGGAPFTIEFVFRYRRPSGHVQAARIRYDCGPGTGTANPPTIVAAELLTSPAALEPGDSLRIRYETTSETGLWITALELGGACDTVAFFGEQLAMYRNRTIDIRIPVGCSIDAPLEIRIIVYDGTLRGTVRNVAYLGGLVDTTQPTLYGTLRSVEHPWVLPPILRTFVGDTLKASLSASDNHQVAVLGWLVEGSGAGDSIITSDPGVGKEFVIPITTEMVGSHSLLFFARDAVGNERLVRRFGSDSLRIYPSRSLPATTVWVPGDVREFQINARRHEAYLMQTNFARIQVVSLPDLATLAMIDLSGSPPIDIDLTPGGDSLLAISPVANDLIVVDLTRGGYPVSRIPLTLLDSSIGQRARYMRATSNGRAFISLEASGAGGDRLLEINLASGAQRLREDAGVSGHVSGTALERSADGTTMLLSNGLSRLQLYDANTDTFGPLGAVARGAEIPKLDATGETALRSLDVYNRSLELVRRLESAFGDGFVYSAISPDGAYAYYVLGYGVLRTRVSDGALVDRVLMRTNGATQSRISSDGRWYLFVDNHHASETATTVVQLQ